MTDKEKIRAEVMRLRTIIQKEVFNSDRPEDADIGKIDAYTEILDFIDSMQEEPVSEDLEKAAEEYAKAKHTNLALIDIVSLDFKAGAQWQKQQIMKDAITGQLENGEDYLRIKCLYTSCRPQDDGMLVKFIIIKYNLLWQE